MSAAKALPPHKALVGEFKEFHREKLMISRLIPSMKIFEIITAILICATANGQVLTRKVLLNEEGDTASIYFVDESGRMSGVQTIFYENGAIKQRQYWQKNYLKDSIVTFDLEGQILGFGLIINNYLMFYRADSVLIYESGLSEGGIYDGLARFYNKSGYLSKVLLYKDGKEDDSFQLSFDTTGIPSKIITNQPSKVIFEKNGIHNYHIAISDKVAVEISFEDNEVVRLNFKLNRKVNGITYYFQDGKTVNRVLFVNGVMHQAENTAGIENRVRNRSQERLEKILLVDKLLRYSVFHHKYHNSYDVDKL